MSKAYKVSKAVSDDVLAYEEANKKFMNAWALFEERHLGELRIIDNLREDRNAKLDQAVRQIREEASRLNIQEVKSFNIGPFSVMKKWTKWFIPEKFYAIAKRLNLLDTAIQEGVIVQKYNVPFDVAQTWIEKNNLSAQFGECEDGNEMTPAVYAPKPVPELGSPSKEK